MRRSQLILVAFGVLVFVLGASAALLASQLSAPHPQLPSTAPTAEECLNCHSDEYRAVERAVRPITIFSAQPEVGRVLPIGMPATGLTVVPIGSDTRPYVVTAANPEVMGEPEMRYLLRTDSGDALLPDTWHVLDEALQAAGAGATPLCEACHLLTPTAPAQGAPASATGL